MFRSVIYKLWCHSTPIQKMKEPRVHGFFSNKPVSHRSAWRAIYHDILLDLRWVTLFLSLYQACSGTYSHFGNPTFSTVHKVVLACPMDDQWEHHSKKIYSLESIFRQCIHFPHIVLHNSWYSKKNKCIPHITCFCIK